MSFRAEQYPIEIQQALAPITSVTTPPHQGMASFVTFAETAQGPVAIKRAAGLRLPALRRERMVLDALIGSGIPIPECILFAAIETGQAVEGWLVMRRLPGEPLMHVLARTVEPSLRLALLSSLGKMVARLHSLDIPPVLEGAQAPWLESMLDQAEACLPLGLWQGSRAQLDALRQHPPAPVPATLIHGDLFLDNVISDGTAITGLVDWAFGAVGDPRYDLALAMDELSAFDRDAFLEGYGLSDGLSPSESEYFLSLAAFC